LLSSLFTINIHSHARSLTKLTIPYTLHSALSQRNYATEPQKKLTGARVRVAGRACGAYSV